MNRAPPKQRFVDGLSAIRDEIGSLDASLNINLITRYEMSEATKALYAFVTSGQAALLRTGDERLRRVLAMVPLNMRRELVQTAGLALEAAASLSDRERLELAHEWSALFGAGSIPAGLPQATAPEAAPEGFKDEIDLAREILRRLAIGLERWPWGEEEKAKGRPRWHVDDEFHVQSLLWLALAPALPGLAYEECLPAIGRTRPRMDLALPGAELAIEAKFIRAPRDFARVTEAIAADSALYTSASPERYSRMIAVVWDDSRSSERYEGFIEGLKALRGVIDAFVIARPGRMGDPKARRSKAAAKPRSTRSASR